MAMLSSVGVIELARRPEKPGRNGDLSGSVVSKKGGEKPLLHMTDCIAADADMRNNIEQRSIEILDREVDVYLNLAISEWTAAVVGDDLGALDSAMQLCGQAAMKGAKDLLSDFRDGKLDFNSKLRLFGLMFNTSQAFGSGSTIQLGIQIMSNLTGSKMLRPVSMINAALNFGGNILEQGGNMLNSAYGLVSERGMRNFAEFADHCHTAALTGYVVLRGSRDFASSVEAVFGKESDFHKNVDSIVTLLVCDVAPALGDMKLFVESGVEMTKAGIETVAEIVKDMPAELLPILFVTGASMYLSQKPNGEFSEIAKGAIGAWNGVVPSIAKNPVVFAICSMVFACGAVSATSEGEQCSEKAEELLSAWERLSKTSENLNNCQSNEEVSGCASEISEHMAASKSLDSKTSAFSSENGFSEYVMKFFMDRLFGLPADRQLRFVESMCESSDFFDKDFAVAVVDMQMEVLQVLDEARQAPDLRSEEEINIVLDMLSSLNGFLKRLQGMSDGGEGEMFDALIDCNPLENEQCLAQIDIDTVKQEIQGWSQKPSTFTSSLLQSKSKEADLTPNSSNATPATSPSSEDNQISTVSSFTEDQSGAINECLAEILCEVSKSKPTEEQTGIALELFEKFKVLSTDDGSSDLFRQTDFVGVCDMTDIDQLQDKFPLDKAVLIPLESCQKTLSNMIDGESGSDSNEVKSTLKIIAGVFLGLTVVASGAAIFIAYKGKLYCFAENDQADPEEIAMADDIYDNSSDLVDNAQAPEEIEV